MKLRTCLTGAVLASALVSAGAFAQQTTNPADLTVKITIEETCNWKVPSEVDFGIHSHTETAPTAQADASIVVQCTYGTPFTILLNQGLYYESGSRRMKHKSSTDYVSYILHRATVSDLWDPSPSQGSEIGGTGKGIRDGNQSYDITFPVEGMATLTGAEPVGDYEDTVEMTLTF